MRAKVELIHIRAAKKRLEQIWPGNCRPALALEVAQIMADCVQRGRDIEREDVVAYLDEMLPEGVAENEVYRITKGDHVRPIRCKACGGINCDHPTL